MISTREQRSGDTDKGTVVRSLTRLRYTAKLEKAVFRSLTPEIRDMQALGSIPFTPTPSTKGDDFVNKMKLKSLTKNLHFFTNSRSHLETSLCKENFFPTAHSVCCHAMHEICWWDCKLHMFFSWKFFSATLERKVRSFLFFFVTLPFPVYTCTASSNKFHYMRVLTLGSDKNLSRNLFFFYFPFRYDFVA